MDNESTLKNKAADGCGCIRIHGYGVVDKLNVDSYNKNSWKRLKYGKSSICYCSRGD